MVGSSVIWAAAAAATAGSSQFVRLAEGSPYGSWVRSYCQETSMDIVFAIDDALASDGSLQDLFDGEAAASLAATADVEDPHFALVKFNKPVKGCSATGALFDELETCASISTSVYDTDQFVDVARQALAPATATTAEDIERANDATFGVVAAGATVFRENTFRLVSVFSSVRARFASAPDLITSPCAAYTGEKIDVGYYTPYCGSSYHGGSAYLSAFLLVNHVTPLIYVASDDVDTVAPWEELRNAFVDTFKLVFKTGVSKADYVATALADMYAYRESLRCSGPWIDWSDYSIAQPAPSGPGRTTMLMLLLDDAVVTPETVKSVPDNVHVQALRFNKQMGNCLPNPSPNGLFDRPDRDGCHMEFLGQKGPDGQRQRFDGGYLGALELRRFVDVDDLEGEVFGGVRAGDLVNALFASAIPHMTTVGPIRSEKIVVLYTGLQPFASHTPCPSTSDQGGPFTPEDGVQAFNILCTGQRPGRLMDAVHEITGKGAHLLVVLPPELADVNSLLVNWTNTFLFQKFGAWDGLARQVYVHVGGVVDGIEELRKRV